MQQVQKSLWMLSMEPLGDDAQVEARFGQFGGSVTSMQYSCMLCVEHTMGLEIGWDAPDGIPR